jgi:hypothetical protein
MCRNIPVAPAYVVHIFQLLLYSKTSGSIQYLIAA